LAESDVPAGRPEDESEARQPYEPPTLTMLGTIADLTAGFANTPGDDAFTGTTT